MEVPDDLGVTEITTQDGEPTDLWVLWERRGATVYLNGAVSGSGITQDRGITDHG